MQRALLQAATELGQAGDEMGKMSRAMEEVWVWATSYPTGRFPPMSDDELDIVSEKLGPKMVTRLHGTWGRNITEGVRDILSDWALDNGKL